MTRQARGIPSRAQLETLFQRLGCSIERPGFYAEPAFIRAEQDQPNLLDAYADYVLRRGQDPGIDIDATVARTCEFLWAALVRKGRLGACLDISMLLSEFLGRQGVWNFIVKGGARVTFRDPTLSAIRMAPVMATDNSAATGHAWVVAPPFQVIDLSIFRQPYPADVQRLLPSEFVASRDLDEITPELEDLVDPEVEAEVAARGGLDMLAKMNPALLHRARTYGSYVRSYGVFSVRWVASAVTASDSPLHAWRTIQLDGLWPGDLWVEFERAL